MVQDEEDDAAIVREAEEEDNEIMHEWGDRAGNVRMHTGAEWAARGGHTEVVHKRGSQSGYAGNIGLRYNEEWDQDLQEGISEGNNSAIKHTSSLSAMLSQTGEYDIEGAQEQYDVEYAAVVQGRGGMGAGTGTSYCTHGVFGGCMSCEGAYPASR
jgi:hypothetical protein